MAKNFFCITLTLLMSLMHQSCIDDVDLHIGQDFNTYVIDAMLVNPDSIQYVKITRMNDEPIDSLTKFSVKLTDDKGNVQTFTDSEEFLANYPPLSDYYNFLEYKGELDSILGVRSWYDGTSYRKHATEIIINNNEEKSAKIFIGFDCKLEIGRTYTLTVTIDGKEYNATEKLLPPIEITKVRYKKIKRFKSLDEGYYECEIPVFSLINSSKESKHFIASLGKLNSLGIGSVRLFSTENMNDTISELQFSEYNYEPAFTESYGTPNNDDDEWYKDNGEVILYTFYPISKANYDYYKVIEKQIKTDGGIYSPAAATPVTNFSGGNIHGQFIVTSESYIYNRGGYNY